MGKMGKGMDLDFEKYCKVDQSPRTVLQSPHHHAKHESKTRKSSSTSKTSRTSLEAGFKEIKFRNYHRSVSCKTLPTQKNELEVDRQVLKRGSVYQCSKERTSFTKTDDNGARKKIELSLSGNSPFSFSLLDSICCSDEEQQHEQKPSSRSSTRVKFDMKNSNFGSHESVGPSSSANTLEENDDQALLKSLSAKLSLPHSPKHSPLIKSKTHQSPMAGVTTPSPGLPPSSRKNKAALPKSLLRDFSSVLSSSTPAHLRGVLKLEHKNGASYFELCLGHSENVLVAKTWKTGDELNWVYTFHSITSRKKCNKEALPPMVGQMQASCHLFSEKSKGSSFSNSLMTEFVLYDIMQARKSSASEEAHVCEARTSNEGLTQAANAVKKGSLNFSVPCADADLHPRNEIAAVAIQVPFTRRKDSSLLDQSFAEHNLKGKNDSSTSTRVCVVTPLGNHGLPSCESRGPSPLLDRWRLGGGCDCGGWDMACPLNVLKGDQPFWLHFQGAKDKSSALTIQLIQKGQYAVDFHAQLSALQVLGICVAILDTTDEVDQEKHRQLLQCSAMKAFFEIEAVTEEKEMEKMVREVEDHPSSFVLNPPFSPIARV